MPQEAKGWTVETAMEHLEGSIASLGKRMDDRFAAQEKAIETATKAATASAEKEAGNAEKWRAASNEWREAMNDRENRFVSKDELNPKLKNLEDKIDQLRESRDKQVGWGSGVSSAWGYLIGAILLAGALVSIAIAFRPH